MGIPLFHVDAFTEEPFAGNPAAVCLLPEARSEEWMQNVAAEMNLSETAFLVREGDAYGLRWFTPTVEVELCGHATLASSHVLWETGALKASEQARFQTLSGKLSAERRGEWIELDFPATPEQPAAAPAGLEAALGAKPVYVGKTRFDYMVEVESEMIVRGLRPDMARVAKIPARGVMVTSRASTPGWDFVSRFFGPQTGVAEDPVTGSAHCCLGPYWAKKLGKTEFTAFQASPRGGLVRVRLAPPSAGQEGDRVRLGGKAVTVLRGELV